MATERIRTVKSSGGDYTTLSGWEAGENADIVSLDEIRIAECYSMTDTTGLTIGGWTTDATRYIEVRTPTSERHPGWWTGSTYILSVSNANGININEEYTRIVGLRIEVSESSTTARNAIEIGSVTTTAIYIEQCLIRQSPSSSGTGLLRGIRGTDSSSTAYVSNTICYDFRQGSGAGFACNSGAFSLYHCGAHDCNIGFERTAGGVTPKNCWAQNCTNGFDGTFGANSTDNCSDIASDAPGSNPETGSIVFVDEAGDNFHLDAGDTVAGGKGADLSADATYPIGIDIDGLVYASWSGINIGPDQFASGGGGSSVGGAWYNRKLLGG